ncbi:MAG: amidase [Pseudomonadota bacterium]|nr:amidase [Pseudomonadota bacterium]
MDERVNDGTPFHCFEDDALGHSDATDLARRLKAGEISRYEVLEAAITRARRTNPVLNGIASERFAAALESPAAELHPAPNRAPFAGVPTFIKDNLHVAGLPTRHGSRAVPPRVTDHTSPFARQLLAQGFECLGKSTLPEFGFNATTEYVDAPATRNPWNLAFSCGASSGGSAALVAAGVVPVAHANDGGGSIRIPAACCGLVGLKPSRGRVANNDAAATLPINIISDGVVTRSVRDTAAFLAAAEQHRPAHDMPPVGTLEEPEGQRFRIGLVLDSISGYPTDPDTRAAVERVAATLEKLGHTLIPMSVPIADHFPDDFALYWSMLAFGVRARGRKLLHPAFDKHQTDPLTNGLARRFRQQFWRLPGALWRLNRAAGDYATAMAGFDAVLTPTLAHTPPPLGHLSPAVPFETLFERLTRYVGFTPLANVTGAPAIAIPVGLTENNLPLSAHLMGHLGGERALLELAYQLEAELPMPKIHQVVPLRQ